MDALMPPQPMDPTMMAADPGGQMPMPDMGPGPSDMYQLMLDIQRQLESEWNDKHQPVYPPWYDEKDYPKPEPAKCLEEINRLETDFMELRKRIEREFAILDFRVSGVFKDFRKNKDNAWYDAGIVGEVELAVAEYADRQITFDAPARFMSEEDEAAKKVDFAHWLYEQAARQHGMMGGGPLVIEKFRTLLSCGRLAWEITLNLDADEDESPFTERLVDPSTCMPVFNGRRGLALMARSYASTYGDAVASFDSEEEDLYNKYFDARNKKSGQFQSVKQPYEYCTVKHWTNPRWRVTFINDDCVRITEHKFGFVPYVYQMSGLGMPAYMRDPSTSALRDVAGFEMSSHIGNRDVAAPHKGIGLVSLLRVPHQLREAIITRMLKAFDRSMSPAKAVEMDDITYNQGLPKWSDEAGALNPLKMGHHKVSTVQTDPSLPMLQGLMGAADDSRSRLQQPNIAHGANDKSNVAGYATNVLNDAGTKKLVANGFAATDFDQKAMEMRFRLYRDWGHLLKQGRDGEYGGVMVARTDPLPGQDRMFWLTPGDLRRTGIQINVTYNHISLTMLGPVAAALGAMKQQGWIDDLRAMKILGSPNPVRERQRIKLNEILNDPAIVTAEVVQALVAEGKVAEAAMFMQSRMGKVNPPADMMGGDMGQPGMMGPGGGSPVIGAVGDSNAAYGYGPGPGSGPGPGMMAPSDPFGTEP